MFRVLRLRDRFKRIRRVQKKFYLVFIPCAYNGIDEPPPELMGAATCTSPKGAAGFWGDSGAGPHAPSTRPAIIKNASRKRTFKLVFTIFSPFQNILYMDYPYPRGARHAELTQTINKTHYGLSSLCIISSLSSNKGGIPTLTGTGLFRSRRVKRSGLSSNNFLLFGFASDC